MNLIRKILCKFNFHDEELHQVEVQPVVYHPRGALEKFLLPSYFSFMWKCKYCKKERIIYK